MSHQETTTNSALPLTTLKFILKSQYRATLAMLRDAIEKCPDDLWVDTSYCNPFWRIAYHTLYYFHLYLQPSADSFGPWEHHQTSIQDMDDVPAPPGIFELIESPDRPPQTGEPYTKEQILDYWTICDGMVDTAVDALDLADPVSHFSWYKVSTLEHKLVALRHTQHHTGQLSDRIRSATNGGVTWTGARHPK